MLPFFYQPSLPQGIQDFVLDEPTSKHCVQVLRMREDEQLMLTDGKGYLATASIQLADKRHCGVRILSGSLQAKRAVTFSLAIAFTKNNGRNEWLLEKLTETGVDHIIPIITARSEKEKFRTERLQGILTAAMLQSQQAYMPRLQEPVPFRRFITESAADQQFIAHCIDSETRQPLLKQMQSGKNTLVLIGPEGDFTKEEIALSFEKGFQPISLGQNRLRTETAGLYACTIFNAINYA
jgi:16S rRNA (uracil1498-N3)-methyltransferase